MEIIGMVHYNNPDDKRCVKCVDFSDYSRLIYAGEEFDCTYCGRAYLDTSETQGEACEPCASVGYSAKAVNRVEDAHGNMTAMCGECIDRNVFPGTPHTYTNSLGEEWTMERDMISTGKPLVFVSELAEGVKVTLNYSNPLEWRYDVRDESGDGEGASGTLDSPRKLGCVMNSAMNSGTEYAESLADDYSDGWDDLDYPYEDEYPYSEPYDSDLWNEW